MGFSEFSGKAFYNSSQKVYYKVLGAWANEGCKANACEHNRIDQP